MKKKIKLMKQKKKEAFMNRKLSLIKQANENYYNSLLFYDIWLRKFMQMHQLYLKEIESNPSRALFGNASFANKRAKG
jgi:hypothetical protein